MQNKPQFIYPLAVWFWTDTVEWWSQNILHILFPCPTLPKDKRALCSPPFLPSRWINRKSPTPPRKAISFCDSKQTHMKKTLSLVHNTPVPWWLCESRKLGYMAATSKNAIKKTPRGSWKYQFQPKLWRCRSTEPAQYLPSYRLACRKHKPLDVWLLAFGFCYSKHKVSPREKVLGFPCVN